MKERIKEIRKSTGKTQQEFADFLNVSISNIASYESGRRSPSDSFIELICEKTGYSQKWLKSGEGQKEKVDVENSEVAELMKLLSGSIVDNSIKLKLSKLLLHVINDMDDKALDMIKNMILDLADEIKKN